MTPSLSCVSHASAVGAGEYGQVLSVATSDSWHYLVTGTRVAIHRSNPVVGTFGRKAQGTALVALGQAYTALVLDEQTCRKLHTCMRGSIDKESS